MADKRKTARRPAGRTAPRTAAAPPPAPSAAPRPIALQRPSRAALTAIPGPPPPRSLTPPATSRIVAGRELAALETVAWPPGPPKPAPAAPLPPPPGSSPPSRGTSTRHRPRGPLRQARPNYRESPPQPPGLRRCGPGVQAARSPCGTADTRRARRPAAAAVPPQTLRRGDTARGEALTAGRRRELGQPQPEPQPASLRRRCCYGTWPPPLPRPRSARRRGHRRRAGRDGSPLRRRRPGPPPGQGRRRRAHATRHHRPAARPGQLRDLVAAHLAGYPAAEFSPHPIGRVLGRSSGAVANALDRLTALGQARLTTENPAATSTRPRPAPRPGRALPDPTQAWRARSCRPPARPECRPPRQLFMTVKERNPRGPRAIRPAPGSRPLSGSS